MTSKLFTRYSNDEKKFLRENYLKCTSAQLGAALGRTEASVVWQLAQLKLKRGGKKIWTTDEIKQLIIDAPNLSRKELAVKFNTTVMSIKTAIGNRKIKTGRTGYFKKGMIAQNKGKKMW